VTFGFIHAEKASYPVRVLCRALDVTPSGYYAWVSRPPAARAVRDRQLRAQLRTAHAAHRGRYGSPRLHRLLRTQGIAVGRNRVIRLMRLDGLRGRRCRRFRVTTDSTHAWPIAPNRLRRQFTVAAPNRVWAADVTYLETTEGWLYLAVVIDLYARRVVGWATRPTLGSDLPAAALHLALGTRQPARGLLHHSDRGSLYASHQYRALLQQHAIIASMSRTGDCYDNAVVESFFSTLKGEIGRARWPSRAAAHRDVAEYIDSYYNRHRLHSTLHYQTPAAAEHAFVTHV
jgi:transposase InsO family protein